jgi:uncharacterized iron-regulated protein
MRPFGKFAMLFWATVLGSFSPLSATESYGEPLIIDTRTLGTVSLDQIVRDVRDADVVFVGESHENRGHHGSQLSVIRELHESGDRVAIGLEMFRSSSQSLLDDWVSGTVSEKDFARAFGDNWTGGLWPEYRPIFLYARENRIRMVGLNIDRGIVRKVSQAGIETIPAESDPRYRSVSCDPEERYRKELEALTAGHVTPYAFVRFCQAQMLWDSAMAWALVDHAAANPGVTTVVLAGIFHSWKYGIPERVEKQSTLSFRVILPSEEKAPFGYNITNLEADYVWWFGA